jgi:hypothetical protein
MLCSKNSPEREQPRRRYIPAGGDQEAIHAGLIRDRKKQRNSRKRYANELPKKINQQHQIK